MKSRFLTVGYLSRRFRAIVWKGVISSGDVVRENGKSAYRSCPLLRLSGNWLAEAGFEVGDKVQVEVSEGRLVITLKEGGSS